MSLPPYASIGEKIWYYALRFFCGLVFLFLITPILVIIPLSFSSDAYFNFTPEMLAFEREAFSLKWYLDIFTNGMKAPEAPMDSAWWADAWAHSQWMIALQNSVVVGVASTLVATVLGTLAAIGLSRSEMPFRGAIMSLLISPMIVPLVVTAAGMFYFYSMIDLGNGTKLAGSYLGLIIAHAILGTPFVIITVTATLTGFDRSLTRAAASLGAGPVRSFFKVQMPLILPGVISGALFAFITSFDEVVTVLFLAAPDQRTIPRQMFSGIREQISPTILAVATILVIISIALLTTLELLRRRSERMRGLSPS